MKIDPVKWNRNASLLYAFGTWTLLGFACYKYMLGEDKTSKRVEKVVEVDGRNVEVHETKHTRVTVIYKEDSVPYTTVFFNFIKSKFGRSTESLKHDEEK